MGLDDRVIRWKPQKSHQISVDPGEWSLVGPIPFLNSPREKVGVEIGVEGFIAADSPPICEPYVVSHVLADRGEIDTGGDAQTRKLNWIADPREHQKLRSIDRPCTQNDLLVGGHLPPLTLCPVSERTGVVKFLDILEGPVPNSTTLKVGVVVPRPVASRSFVAWA